jgi:Type IV secretion system pilin
MDLSQKTKGLVIASAAGSTLLAVPLVASAAEEGSSSASTGAGQAQPTGTPDDLKGQLTVITNTLLLGIGFVSVVMLIIGGFRYVLSNGNEKSVTAAKDTILYAIIGVVIALLSFAIINFVLGTFAT